MVFCVVCLVLEALVLRQHVLTRLLHTYQSSMCPSVSSLGQHDFYG